MKILQINSVSGIGSTGKIVTDISKVVQKKGHECLIAYGRDNKTIDGVNNIRIGNKIDVYIHTLYSRITDKTGFASKRVTKTFINNVDTFYKPDIIHLHNIHGYYINIEILFNYLKFRNIPVVWTLHDCWAFTGHCAYNDYIHCELWKTHCTNICPQQRSYPKSLFISNAEINYKKKKELFTSINNLTIVTPSKWLSNLVKKSFFKEYSTRVINNGINLDIFRETQSDFRKKMKLGSKYIILGVANIWDKRKGFNDFIKLSEMIDDQCHIVLVGISDRQVRSIKNIRNITGIKKTTNAKELAGLYSTADVFFNPTYEDNFPTVNLEALACGTPVITYDTGGSPECIQNENGVVVAQGSLGDVINIINNWKIKRRKANISKMSNLYGCSHMADEYIRLYEEIIY